MNKALLLIITISFLAFALTAQIRVVQKPNVAQQTHPEMTIEEIQFFADSTVFKIKVINKLASGGWFCADKNTFVEEPQSLVRRRLIKAIGIPWCPDAHRFTRENEILHFSLVFPALPVEAELLNLVEQCDRACFAFRGIILNEKLNRDINLFDEAMDHYASNRFQESIHSFSIIVEEIPLNPTHVYGYSYYHLIRINWELGQKDIARIWIQKLEQSGLPNRQYFIDNIRRELK
jgi:hypothetical protein